MKNFEYAAPRSVAETVALLAQPGRRPRLLAGGTDILVQLREGAREADLVIDVKRIAELTAVRFDAAGGLHLGASVPAADIYNHDQIVRDYSALVDACQIIGGWQIQSRASVGGNLCNSSPAADSTPALIALGAVAVVAGPSGTREVPVEEFCIAPGRNVLGPAELLVALKFPPPARHAGSHYLRFIPRNEMDIAVVGAGAWVQLDPTGQKIERARIGLGAVAPTPLLAREASDALAGQPATAASFRAAGERARKVAKPISDMRAPAEYRVHLVGVLVERALARAVQRAREPR